MNCQCNSNIKKRQEILQGNNNDKDCVDIISLVPNYATSKHKKEIMYTFPTYFIQYVRIIVIIVTKLAENEDIRQVS